MTKKPFSTAALLLSIAMCGPAEAAGLVNISNQTIEHDRTWYGPTRIQESTATGSLRIAGPSNFEGSEFMGYVSVTGSFHSTASHYEAEVSVTGPMMVRTSVFQSHVSVIGPLNTTKSQFKKTVSITGPVSSSKTQFTGLDIKGGSNKLSNKTSAERVTITYNGRRHNRPYLCLDGNSKVSNVTFSGVKGHVYLEDRRSSVTGRVRNGETIRGRCPER